MMDYAELDADGKSRVRELRARVAKCQLGARRSPDCTCGEDLLEVQALLTGATLEQARASRRETPRTKP